MNRRDGGTRGIWRVLLPASAVLSALPRGCRAHGNPDIAIPTAHIAAPRPATRLVVVPPGRADDLEDLQGSGAVQRAWPDADVVLAGLTLDYVPAQCVIPRLHREIVAPARGRYEAVWIVGASLGGRGALPYDREHPGTVDGLVLFAPYPGERALRDEIRAAGGLAAWRAGASRSVDAGSWQREPWRHVQSLPTQPDAPRVWLACGNERPLRCDAVPRTGTADTPVRIHDGGHDWTVWTAAAHDALRAARPR